MFSLLPSVNLPVVVLKFYTKIILATPSQPPLSLSLYLGKVLFRQKKLWETFRSLIFFCEEMFAIETNIFPSLGHILLLSKSRFPILGVL